MALFIRSKTNGLCKQNDIYRKRKREEERKRMTLQVKLNKTGAFVGETHNHDKIAGEEKCVSETEGVKERQRTAQRRSDRKCNRRT